jgi:hypothetical protein
MCEAADVADEADVDPPQTPDEDSIPTFLDRRAEPNGNGHHREPCAQCNADDGQQIQFCDVWLHKECKPFWCGER